MTRAETQQIIDALTGRFITEGECRACDNTGSIPGNNMGDPSRPCLYCGRGRNLTQVIAELAADV